MRGVLLRVRVDRARDDGGSMLTELIVTLVIFAILSTGLLTLALTAVKTVSASGYREAAIQLAGKDLEVVRSNKITDLTQGRTTSTQKVGNISFKVDRDATFVPMGASDSGCGASGPPAYLRVTTTVSWKENDPAQRDSSGWTLRPVTASTLVTPGIGTYDKTDGNFGVKVLDRDGKAQPNVTVTMSGAGTGTQKTGTDGCAFFAFRDPGSYTATLSAPNYVDPTGATNPSNTQSVTTGTTVNAVFTYDEASTIDFDVDATTDYPAPSTLPFSVYNTAFLNSLKTRATTVGAGNPSAYFPGGTATLANKTMTGLFPSTAGYVVWAGTCRDADPGAARQAPIVVNPGATTDAAATNLQKYMVTVTGLAVGKTWTLTAKHDPDTTSPIGCASGETYNLVTTAAGNATSSSMIFSGSLPFGKWTFTATSNAKTKSATDTWPAPATSTPETLTVAIT